jgi:ABC-type multidrug transport system fused ATPase/permease subunit
MTNQNRNNGGYGSDWPAAVVAVAILALLGTILVTATIRWTAKDLADLLQLLLPIILLAIGAFTAFFFTRHVTASTRIAMQEATASAKEAMQEATASAKDAVQKANDLTTRMVNDNRAGERALTEQATISTMALKAALSIADGTTEDRMRQDPAIMAARRFINP